MWDHTWFFRSISPSLSVHVLRCNTCIHSNSACLLRDRHLDVHAYSDTLLAEIRESYS